MFSVYRLTVNSRAPSDPPRLEQCPLLTQARSTRTRKTARQGYRSMAMCPRSPSRSSVQSRLRSSSLSTDGRRPDGGAPGRSTSSWPSAVCVLAGWASGSLTGQLMEVAGYAARAYSNKHPFMVRIGYRPADNLGLGLCSAILSHRRRTYSALSRTRR